MIENFDTIQELLFKIRKDKETQNITENRFPVRFVFLSSFKTLQKLVIETGKIGIQKIEIANFINQDDGWITTQNLIDNIKALDSNTDFILLPFSEIARFYNKEKFQNLFSQLIEIENITNPKRRIYIPLTGIKNRFETEFYNKFSRKHEYSFLWEISEEIKRAKIFLFDKQLNFETNKIQIVKDTKGWLTIWTKDLNTPSLCQSEVLSYLSENTIPDKIFDFVKITTIKELIENICNISIPFDYKEEEKIFWETFAENITKADVDSFIDYLRFEFNTNRINTENFITLWLACKSDYQKWLLKNYMSNLDCLSEKYLYEVLAKMPDYQDLSLLKLLWLEIFNSKNISNEYIEERDQLIQQFNKNSDLQLSEKTVSEIENQIDKIDNTSQKISLLIGILTFEKQILFEYSKTNPSLIKNKFPLLYYYFCDFETLEVKDENNWIKQYFIEYQKAKQNNVYTIQIKELIGKYNENEKSFYEWYYSFKDVNAILSEYQIDEVFWIDAIGIEWIGLLQYCLQQKKYTVESIQVAKVNLPTITDVNRYEKAVYIQDFDKFIHDNLYKYPQSIVNEIELIAGIIQNKINIDTNKRAAIISDHGLSALVRLQESRKYNFKTEHEGRYAKIDAITGEDENYIISEKHIVASKHNSLSTKPLREVHGGCMPEEVLVPVIIFSSFPKEEKKQLYQIELLTKELDIKTPKVVFRINPIPQNKIYVHYSNTKIELTKNAENLFIGVLENIKSGIISLTIKVSDLEETFSINVKSGFAEDDLF